MHYPENLAQLKEIITSARERKVGLVPRSSSGESIHGASVNEAAEIVSFEKMNKIMAVNRHDRYIRVQSGVTFAQLLPEVEKEGLRLNVPFLPRGSKSVVASALEREAVTVPKYQFDYTDPLLNVEVVYGTGEDLRSGSAAGPGPAEETKADKVSPWGPGTIDYLRFLMGAEGTMGFVTWATMKAELAPTLSRSYYVESGDLGALMALANKLLFKRIPDECIILNNVALAAAFTDGGQEELSAAENSAPWTLICKVCGFERYPEERVEIYGGYFEDCCKELGLSFAGAPACGSEMAEKIEAMLGKCDERETYWKLRRGGIDEVLFLAPPSKAEGCVKCGLSALEAYDSANLGVVIQPQVQGRAYRVEFELFHGKDEDVSAVKAEAEKALFAEKAFFDRPYGELSGLVYDENSQETALLRKMKAIFDPDGILNPGKLCFEEVRNG